MDEAKHLKRVEAGDEAREFLKDVDLDLLQDAHAKAEEAKVRANIAALEFAEFQMRLRREYGVTASGTINLLTGELIKKGARK